jgi:hypothetical protein
MKIHPIKNVEIKACQLLDKTVEAREVDGELVLEGEEPKEEPVEEFDEARKEGDEQEVVEGSVETEAASAGEPEDEPKEESAVEEAATETHAEESKAAPTEESAPDATDAKE